MKYKALNQYCPSYNSDWLLIKLSQLILIGVFFGSVCQASAVQQKPKNILFISVDDLRPTIGAYGDTIAQTPSLDRLAEESRVFLHHYVQAAVCSTSRAALLSGQRLRDGSIWSKLRRQPEPENPVSWAHHLRRFGYETISIGKVSHQPGGVIDKQQNVHEIPFSWDEAFGPVGIWQHPWGAFFGYADGSFREYGYGRNKTDTVAYEYIDVDDNGYADGLIAEEAVKKLEQLTGSASQPFCLAVGFYKPHLPHNAPSRYWDLYDPVKIPQPSNSRPPKGANPEYSLHPSFELTTHYDWPGGEGNITEAQARKQRHAYYACVSYVDTQIGKVLDALDRLGLAKTTIVALWSDHGWHLGEGGIFGKQTNFEVATRSPLMISVPGMNQPGAATSAIVETVDLFPTLAELSGTPIPEGLAGKSLLPWLDDPEKDSEDSAHSFFIRRKEGYWGDTVRTSNFRLVHWWDVNSGQSLQVELYDLRSDPQETINVADRPKYASVVRKLMTVVKDYSGQVRQ